MRVERKKSKVDIQKKISKYSYQYDQPKLNRFDIMNQINRAI